MSQNAGATFAIHKFSQYESVAFSIQETSCAEKLASRILDYFAKRNSTSLLKIVDFAIGVPPNRGPIKEGKKKNNNQKTQTLFPCRLGTQIASPC